jgi:hypothetical protein
MDNGDNSDSKRQERQPYYREDGIVVAAEVVRKVKDGFIVIDPNTGIEVRHTESKIREILKKISLVYL